MVKRTALALLIIGSLLGNGASLQGDKVREKIYIVPFGKMDPKTVETLRRPLERTFEMNVVVLQEQPLPSGAYDAARGQYLSTAFLDTLRRIYPEDTAKALAVADVDLYVPRLNFVFGEAERPGKVAVISITRLRPEYYGKPEDLELFSERMIKEAVHELGHTFGVWHCLNPRCVMFFSNSLMDTDRKGPDFCTACEKQLKQHVRSGDKSR